MSIVADFILYPPSLTCLLLNLVKMCFKNTLFPTLGKDSGLHMRDDMRGQLKEASSVTSKAFSTFRKELDPDLESLCQNSDITAAEDVLEEPNLSPAITIMKPILRFLQLLCENHNSELQVLALSLLPRRFRVQLVWLWLLCYQFCF